MRQIGLVVAFAAAGIGCAHKTQAPESHPAKTDETTASSTVAEAPNDSFHHHHKHGALAKQFSLPRRLVDGKKGTVLDPSVVFEQLLASRVIYVSEQHNNPHHHAAQLAVIAALYARDPSLAI